MLLVAACAREPSGDLEDVAAGLRSLERATIDLQLEVGDTGFTIDGAFSVSGERPLPVARLTYEPVGDGTVTTVVLTGDDGFVEVDGVAYRLPPAQLDALRIPDGGATSALSTIRLEEWLDDPTPDEDGVSRARATPSSCWRTSSTSSPGSARGTSRRRRSGRSATWRCARWLRTSS